MHNGTDNAQVLEFEYRFERLEGVYCPLPFTRTLRGVVVGAWCCLQAVMLPRFPPGFVQEDFP